MTKEDKELLLQDLCGRLPYGVKVLYGGQVKEIQYIEPLYNELKLLDFSNYTIGIEDVKPYLRPLSSMTVEEREDFWQNVLGIDWRSDLEIDEELETVPFPFTETNCGFYFDNYYLSNSFHVIDWLNAHHFDYRGLIPKGLAISIEKFNPYND